MDRIVLRIAGKSEGKARPKFDPRTRRAYSPPSNIISEGDVRQIWREAGEPRIEDDVAIRVLAIVVVVRPQGHFKSNGELSKLGLRHPVPRTRKPDLDNCIKLLLDALNSRAYKDDVQVAEVGLVRRWGSWPETLVVIEPIHEPIE